MMSPKSLIITGLGFGAALGIALGTLVIAPNMDSGSGPGGESTSEVREKYGKLVLDNNIAEAQLDSADSVMGDLGRYVVDGSLAQRPVMVVSMPDADDADVKAVKDLLGSADSTDAGSIKLTEKFVAQESADKLLSLVTTTLPAGAKLDKKKIDAGTHAGQALAAGLMMDAETTEPLASVDDRATLLRALRDAGYIDYKDGTILPAQAVVVVGGGMTPGEEDDSAAAKYAIDTTVNFLEGFDSVDTAMVYAGRVESAGDDGVLDKLRADKTKISTVDSIDHPVSQMASVLAVKEQLDGGHGVYGSAANADSAAPALPKDL
ncbi:copper transporter [Corynebacterium aurimucosum]|uniref:Copper transporter n=2 Tax=Corynebacterium TaxID=1716 RepID=A0ABT0T7Z0_9CORY|nr:MULTISPECIES: copper transporter [Corynebacterium]MBE7340203.1 copper transporter [Corynebacterium aurimucosum]MCL8493085.1 copper transporter [Corynebacterium intestinale]MCP1389317.1 copper transporter [Corynebacterium intestinale]MDK6807240.1 copper transporter [Corynebacterium aurimucosum]MTE10943.1 copper transporter [Corynebacterium guaraldiae]